MNGEKKRRGRWVLPSAVVVCALVLAVALWQLGDILGSYNAAADEYGTLLEDFGPRPEADASGDVSSVTVDHEGLSALNPDYVGWMDISGTGISYPVVRGANNSTYLHTSFEGAGNPAGAIFMDTGCETNFSSQHTIVYGHNMKDGSMFNGLYKYLDPAYLAAHPLIMIDTPEGGQQSWRIFAARQTDISDVAYRLTFSAPEDFGAFCEALDAPPHATRLLTLSTCTNGYDDERILVHAFLEQ